MYGRLSKKTSPLAARQRIHFPDLAPLGNLPSWRRATVGQSPGQAFAIADRELDRTTQGPMWLKDPRIAQLVMSALRAGDRELGLYKLRAYVVMANHVHVLLLPAVPVPKITRWLKGTTARRANQILGRTGQPFWQDESYDHWARNGDELNRIVRYIENNPVAAGLTDSLERWPWSSAYLAGESPAPP